MGKWIRRVIMIVLLAVFVFSAGTIAYVMVQYKKSDRLYAAASEAFVRPSPYATQKEEGKQEPSGQTAPAEPSGQPTPVQQTAPSAEPIGDQGPEVAPILVDFDALRAVNSDVQGWIYCEDTVINYPVVRADDNDYYLHRSYDGTANVSGSIFMEALNAPGFYDSNTILYGHHMKNGSMFASLDSWFDQAYYEAHPVMWLLTPEQDYKLVLFSGYNTSAFSDTYTVIRGPGRELTAYLANVEGQSLFRSGVTPDAQSRYVVLSTCAYFFEHARSVLHGMLVPVNSAGGVPFS